MMINSLYKNKLYDAGFVQRREWMLQKVRDDHYPFNVSIFIETEMYEELFFLEMIRMMMERHQVLRTTLSVIDGKLKQVIHDPYEYKIDLSFFDLSEMTDAEKMNFHDDKKGDAMGMGFDFATGPLFRILVFKATDKHYLTYFIFHHVISDQRSTEIFNKEIVDIYKMLSWNSSGGLSEKNLQYREYADFENELLDTSKGDSHRLYWQKVLSHGIPEFSCVSKERRAIYHEYYLTKAEDVRNRLKHLPYVDKRSLPSVIRRFRIEDAGELVYGYDDEVTDKLAHFQSNSKNGLLSLLIGSLLLAFKKISGQQKFSFEMPASRRVSNLFNNTMGWLTGGGACYFDISDCSDPSMILEYIDHQLYELSLYCAFPYEAIFYDSEMPPGSHMPVFLSLSYVGRDNHSKEKGIVSKRSNGSGTYQDIAFSFTRYNNGLRLVITYNNVLFTDELAELTLHEHVQALKYIMDKCNYA